MYRLHVTGPTGVEAEFTVGSATLALDLALRSVRAGMCWTAEHLAPERVQRLTLSALRQNAANAAANEAERTLLDQVEWQHELQSSFALN
jgi:hypothetical protein